MYVSRNCSYLLLETKLRELHVSHLVEEVVSVAKEGLMCRLLPPKWLQKARMLNAEFSISDNDKIELAMVSFTEGFFSMLIRLPRLRAAKMSITY